MYLKKMQLKITQINYFLITTGIKFSNPLILK